ncbi:hypothetical protein DM01DRAFT_1332113 [Hesseltinella vesiculosa]|uniref:DinB-like domain-containing protein n=1 Tax=Hesseltinella vesiculosa TaxID=101127 RepID=A0A1X2GU26_9FUNG|nr:hypothetical protein DM01DRAFT_1332113 [Hesseltinella vesiculosa]
MHLYDVADHNVQQAMQLIAFLPEAAYTHPSKVMPYSTIGKHVRHAYDHFVLLLKQIGKPHWTIDYDVRQRNTPMEVNRLAAIEQLEELQMRLKEIREIPLETPVTLSASIDAHDPTKYPFSSTFGRELWYCVMHAVHHFASIKAICIEQGLDLPQDFGLAPSTILSHSA